MSAGTAIVQTERQQWLERRRELIGASDVAAILGRDPRRGALAVWAEKIGALQPEETPWMRRGRRLEAAIAEEYVEVAQRAVLELDPYAIATHPDLPWLGATLDRQTEGSTVSPAPAGTGGIAPLELKAVSGMKAKEWRAEPPEHFLIQVQVQVACTGAQWASLAALIGGLQLAWVDVLRHDRFIVAMLPKLEEFRWHVQRREAPEADGLPGTSDVLKALYAEEDGETVELDDQALALATELDAARATKRSATADERGAANKLKALMGTATFAKLPDGSFLSLKTIDRVAYEVEETSYRQLRRFWPRLKRR